MPVSATPCRRRRGPRRSFLRWCARQALRVGALQERACAAPGAYVAALVGLTVVLGLGLARLTVDNRLEAWTATASSPVQEFEEGDFVAMVHSGPAQDAAGFLERDRRLASLASSLMGTRDVEASSAVLDRLGAQDLDALGDAARFLDGYLLTSDRHLATVRVWLKEGLRRDAFVAELRAALAGEPVAPALLGPAAFNAALDERSRAESMRVFPIATALLAGVLWAILGSASLALRVMGCALTSVVWLLGAMGWLGLSLNFVSISVPVILVVTVLSLLLHPLQLLMGQERPEGRRRSLRRLALVTLPGAALSALTSAGGFLTLGLGPAPAVRRFGLLCAAAMMVALAASILALPIVATRARRPSRFAAWLHGALHRCLRRLGERHERRPLLSFASVVAIVACGALLALRIPVNHQPLDFLSPDEPLRMAYEELGPRAGGLAPLELSLELGADPWSPAGLRSLERCAVAAAGAAGVETCFSLAAPVKLAAARMSGGAEGSYALPADDRALAAAAAMVRLTSPEATRLVSAGGASCRLILPLPLLGGRQFQELSRGVLRRLEELPPARAAPRGIVHRLMALQDGILSSQAAGLVLGLAGASLLLGAVLGSRRQTLAAVLVNLLPLSLAAAFMGWRQISLDLSTAMVASISLGISVDDSARFLWAYWRGSLRSSRPVALAVEQAGPATVLTGVLLAAGFGSIALARFPPIARFGGLTAATLLGSVACHLLVLPALLRDPGAAIGVRSAANKERHEVLDLRA